MRPLFFTILTLISVICTKGQDLTVYNAKTGRPVEGVVVFSEDYSTQTNKQGQISLELFSENEPIEFKHSSYLSYKSNVKKLESQGFIVLLIEDPIKLDEIVISVSRRQQAKTEVPNMISTIGIDEVYNMNPQTTADLLGSKGGVFIQKSQMGGGSPMIRGFSANRVLLVVDGIRMNNAIFRSGNIHNVISLDANSIETTEIIFGPGSVIYGSDAMGGVMSFNTLTPKLSTSDEYSFSNHVLTRYSTANKEKTIHGDFNYGTNKFAVLGSVTYSDFDDLKMGTYGPDEYLRHEYVSKAKFEGNDFIIRNDNSQVQRYTGYSQLNLMAKARYRPSNIFEMNVSSHYSGTSDIPRYDRYIVYSGDQLKYGDWYYGPQVWAMQNVNIQYKKETVFFDQINFITAFQNYKESRNNRKINNPELTERIEKLTITSFNFDLDKSIDKNNLFYYGLEGYFNKINSTGETTNLLSGLTEPAASRYPDNSKFTSLAGYLTYKFNYKKKFTLQSGIRYTLTHLKGKFSKDFYNFPFSDFNTTNSAVNGNIGIVWHPTGNWQINLIAATGFRSPNIDDISKVFDSEPGNVVVPNPNLKPEYTRGIEFDIIRSYEHKAKFELNIFYTYLKDAMVRRNFTLNGHDSILYEGEMSKVEALVNAQSAQIYGGSFTFEYLINNYFRTRHNITITKGEDSDKKPIRHVSPTFGNSHMIFQDKAWFIDLYIQYSDKISYENLEESERDKPHIYAIDDEGHPFSPEWWTLNLKSSYKVNKQITFSGGVENILDKRYRSYSSGIVAPGINFVFSIVSSF
ncbi:MAG: TonB-dependent receptor [Mariniphaga sp.]|nr:TonB-dependent receptor [Mariniphaga sp.]